MREDVAASDIRALTASWIGHCPAGQTSLTAAAKDRPARAARPPAPERPKRTRAPKKPAVAPAAEAAVDPEKDKALLDAFSSAIAAAMSQKAL